MSTRDNRQWARGYFCAVATLLKETMAKGAADTACVSLFRQGGKWNDADPEDIETFKQHGLIAAQHSDAAKEGKTP